MIEVFFQIPNNYSQSGSYLMFLLTYTSLLFVNTCIKRQKAQIGQAMPTVEQSLYQ
jgi:hypothetical protein